jgi:hypothetical protein
MESFGYHSRNRIPFTTYAAIRRGLTTGYNAVFVNPELPEDEQCLIDIISTPKSVIGFSTNNAKKDKLLVVKSNENRCETLRRYLENWEKTITSKNNPKTLAEKIRKGEAWYKLNTFDCKGIIFGYIIRSDMRFIMNESEAMVRDNFYVIYPSIDSNTMLALLNNYYAYSQLETIGRKHGGGMLKLQKYDIESMMLQNLSVFSKNDLLKLSTLGHLLAESGDSGIICEITKLLSKYESITLDKVKSQYEYLRNKRLENMI